MSTNVRPSSQTLPPGAEARRGFSAPRERWMEEVQAGARFLRGIRPFLDQPLNLCDARRILTRQMMKRETAFARILEHGVFGNPASPYRLLFERAEISFRDVSAMLAGEGLEATLGKLYDAGVYVTLEEFKGRAPLIRSGLALPLRAEDFDNPLMTGHYEARTGGSGGMPRRILIDLNLLEHESAYHALFYASAGMIDHPLGIWQPVPPGSVGIKTALMHAKLGRPTARWFSQTRWGGGSTRHALFARATLLTAQLCGARIPMPEYTPASAAGKVANWLAEQRARRTPAILVTPASAGVRACQAAIEQKLDISGTLFVLGGEPYTQEKAAVIEQTGSRAVCHYAMVESGMIGLGCLSGDRADHVHLVTDKIATIQSEKRVGKAGATVNALFHTTLLPTSPKLMLNVESGDYAIRTEKGCSCGSLPAGFSSSLHTIRSYEKLTSEGMNFLGTDLLELVERILPTRFGGHPTDYQFVEWERNGLPIVSLVIAPRVGILDHADVVRVVLEYLRSRGLGETMMTDMWIQSGTLQIVRQEPHVTSAGKILPLQTMTG